MASSEELFAHPLHPYTKSLLSAIPKPDQISEKNRKRIIYNPVKEHDYTEQKPTLQEILPGHFVLANDVEIERYNKEIKQIDKDLAAHKE
jgi:oligopeptide transport system ATP-binding protein